MELHEIKRLVYGGESDQVEFKRKVSHPEKVVREVVAFANTAGGRLIIGVDDDRTIVGLKYADEEDFLMQKAIRELCRPAISFEVETIPISEKRAVLIYTIHPGNQKPYFAFYKKEHRYGRAFVRVKDRSIQASAELRRVLKQSNQPKDGHFHYGTSEQKLFNYLHDHHQITLNEFRELTGLDQSKASATLVQLVLANVLRLEPREQEDWYMSVS